MTLVETVEDCLADISVLEWSSGHREWVDDVTLDSIKDRLIASGVPSVKAVVRKLGVDGIEVCSLDSRLLYRLKVGDELDRDALREYLELVIKERPTTPRHRRLSASIRCEGPVVKINLKDGTVIRVLGTSHDDPQSVQDVAEEILSDNVTLDCVIVELDATRLVRLEERQAERGVESSLWRHLLCVVVPAFIQLVAISGFLACLNCWRNRHRRRTEQLADRLTTRADVLREVVADFSAYYWDTSLSGGFGKELLEAVVAARGREDVDVVLGDLDMTNPYNRGAFVGVGQVDDVDAGNPARRKDGSPGLESKGESFGDDDRRPSLGTAVDCQVSSGDTDQMKTKHGKGMVFADDCQHLDDEESRLIPAASPRTDDDDVVLIENVRRGRLSVIEASRRMRSRRHKGRRTRLRDTRLAYSALFEATGRGRRLVVVGMAHVVGVVDCIQRLEESSSPAWRAWMILRRGNRMRNKEDQQVAMMDLLRLMDKDLNPSSSVIVQRFVIKSGCVMDVLEALEISSYIVGIKIFRLLLEQWPVFDLKSSSGRSAAKRLESFAKGISMTIPEEMNDDDEHQRKMLKEDALVVLKELQGE